MLTGGALLPEFNSSGTQASQGETPSQLTGDQNNYSLDSGFFLRLSSTTAVTISGIAAESGRSVYLVNVGSSLITLSHQGTASTAANRIISPTAADLQIGANEFAHLWYDDTTARWRILESNGD